MNLLRDPPSVQPVPPAGLRRRALLLLAAAGAWRGARAQAEDEPVVHTLPIAGSQIEVQFAPGFDAPLRDEALRWVRRSAEAVAAYLGRFPVPRAELLLVPIDGAGIGSGVSYGEPDPLVRVRVGRRTDTTRFLDDWVLVHEMVHLAIPGLPRAQRWLHEGMATYVETIARTRAGLVAEPALWGGLAHGLPQGQPRDGDRGLDHTPTWGRTYWGGAMFCLLAVADAAIGQAALTELYALMKDCPRQVDLDALWRDLGVSPDGDGGATLRDDAPLASIRRAIVG